MKQAAEKQSDLFSALQHQTQLNDVVPATLDVLERDPLASAGHFRGDLLRALIELPPDFWHRNGKSFRRYQAAVRAGAVARRSLPSDERMEFWSDIRQM